MTRQGLCIANIHQAFEKLQGIVQFLSCLEASANAKAYKRTTATTRIFLRKDVIGTFRKS
jgi:hypothetical protein